VSEALDPEIAVDELVDKHNVSRGEARAAVLTVLIFTIFTIPGTRVQLVHDNGRIIIRKT
jgi:hypothetical protein